MHAAIRTSAVTRRCARALVAALIISFLGPVWAAEAADPVLLAWGQNVSDKINASLKVPGSSLYAEAARTDLAQSATDVSPIQDMPFGRVFTTRDPSGQTLYMLELRQPQQA